MKIAFIDLAVHRKTKSTRFIIDEVLSGYQVDEFYLEKKPAAMVNEIANSNYELVICFQTEFVAPIFLMLNIPTVIIPMFDAVESAPSWYWEMMGGSTAINFSRAVNSAHQGVGLRSRYYQYWNKKFKKTATAKFNKTLHGFFWQRRPEQGLSWKFATRLLRNSVDSLHIHNSPDNVAMTDHTPIPLISHSQYGSDNSLYLEKLGQANIFICPRHSEGLGHTIIEAMSKGMCVIANNTATHNEYIVDGMNGLLIDYNQENLFISNIRRDLPNSITLNVDKAKVLGEAARKTASLGIQKWESDKVGLKLFILSTPRPFPNVKYRRLSKQYLSALNLVFSHHSQFMAKAFRLYTLGLYINNNYEGSQNLRILKNRLRYGRLARSYRRIRKFIKK